MSTETTQRVYRAACPGCGAPITFLSAQATHAVCGYCHSIVVRDGETLSRIGKMAELFNDHSPLQLNATGQTHGQSFTLAGRLQYTYAEGSWTEWYAVLADGSHAFLSEDNGAYVWSKPVVPKNALPAAEYLRVGRATAIQGKTFSISSNQQATLIAAQGELPHPPTLGTPFAVVELRSDDGAVLSVEYDVDPPRVSMGSAVALADLKMVGLRDDSTKEETGRQFNCPHCGATITPQFATTQSLTCNACHCLIDVSAGVGGELRHAVQDEPVNPLIPLGSQATLQGVTWQVVGFQHRMGHEPGDDSESFGWEEYLLFNLKKGFIFLVDASDGWSVVHPATGAPTLSADGQRATYLGSRYALKESYNATTDYVLGEFYWQVYRDQATSNSDYVSGNTVLNMEQSAHEVVWSVGSKIDSALVVKAFGLEHQTAALKRVDVSPVSASASNNWSMIGYILLAIVFIVIIESSCSNCDDSVDNCASNGARTSGGSYGGYSAGGGHK